MNPEKLAALIRESLEGCRMVKLERGRTSLEGVIYRDEAYVASFRQVFPWRENAGWLTFHYDDIEAIARVSAVFNGASVEAFLRALSDLPGAPAEWGAE